MAIGDTTTPPKRTYQGPALAPVVAGSNSTMNNLDNILVPGRTFNTRQVYGDLIKQLTDRGDRNSANSFYMIAKDLADRDSHVNNFATIFDNLGQRLNQDMVNRNVVYNDISGDLLGKLADQWTSYQSMFGPEGEQAKRINQLYGGLIQQASNRQNNDAASAAGMASRYGLSANASRGLINQAQGGAIDQALKIYEQENGALNNLNQLFGQFSDNYVKNYKGVQDDYIKSLADSNFGVRNTLSNSYLQLLGQSEQMKQQAELQQALAKLTAGTGGSSTPTLSVQQNRTNPTTTPTAQTPAQTSIGGGDILKWLSLLIPGL